VIVKFLFSVDNPIAWRATSSTRDCLVLGVVAQLPKRTLVCTVHPRTMRKDPLSVSSFARRGERVVLRVDPAYQRRSTPCCNKSPPVAKPTAAEPSAIIRARSSKRESVRRDSDDFGHAVIVIGLLPVAQSHPHRSSHTNAVSLIAVVRSPKRRWVAIMVTRTIVERESCRYRGSAVASGRTRKGRDQRRVADRVLETSASGGPEPGAPECKPASRRSCSWLGRGSEVRGGGSRAPGN